MMQKLLTCLALGALAVPSFAQNCLSTNVGTSLGPGGDVVFPIQPIGFAFPLGGTTYSDIHVCDKGFVYLSNAGVPAPGVADFSATAAELASGPPRVCALWSDIQCLAANGGEVFINSTATDCRITWKNASIYQQVGGPYFEIQMTLNVAGSVNVVYGPNVTNGSSPTQATWQVGIAGVSPGGGVALPPASDLSAGGSTVDDTLFEEWLTNGQFDMAGSGLDMIPTNPGWVYVPASQAACAATMNYGMGCVDAAGSPNSFYEGMQMAAFDLNGTTISMIRTGLSYTVANSLTGTFVPPGAGAVPVAAGQLDGQEVITLSTAVPFPGGATDTITVTTKGQILVGSSTAPVDFTPTPAELLAYDNTVFGCWHDYDQTSAGSGIITFEELGGLAYVTWDAVNSYTTTAPNTFQFQINLATGSVTLVIVTMSGAASGDDIVVGYSYAGMSADPGATDLSSSFGVLTVYDDTIPLAMTGVGDPVLGSTAFSFEVSQVPSLVPLAFMFFGDTQANPGVDLTFLGMAGCFGYTNGNLLSLSVPVGSGGTANQPLPIPNNATLAGSQLFVQSAAFSLDTALNLITSNGTAVTIGY